MAQNRVSDPQKGSYYARTRKHYKNDEDVAKDMKASRGSHWLIWDNLNIKINNDTMVGRIMTVRDAHILIPNTFEHRRLQGKGKLRLLINDPKLAHYPGLFDGPNVIRRVIKSGRERHKKVRGSYD